MAETVRCETCGELEESFYHSRRASCYHSFTAPAPIAEENEAQLPDEPEANTVVLHLMNNWWIECGKGKGRAWGCDDCEHVTAVLRREK